jgi:hypothetical protein
MRTVVMVQVEQRGFRIRRIVVEQCVGDKIWTETKRRFRETEF